MAVALRRPNRYRHAGVAKARGIGLALIAARIELSVHDVCGSDPSQVRREQR